MKSRMHASVPTNRFAQAVHNTPSLGQDAYHPGLRALGSNSSKVRLGKCDALGSIYLEESILSARWDYGIGIKKDKKIEAVWVEVHPAYTSEVDRVIEKLRWLKDWLRQQAPDLWALTPSNAYYWVATNGVHITRDSPQARSLAQAGLTMPRRVLELCP